METRRGPGVAKCKFTPQEDARLREVVERCGTNDWAEVARQMHPRNGRQCRERWTNYLNPTLQNCSWTAEEEILLDEKLAQFGPRWRAGTACFANRSRNSIKNHVMSKRRHKSRAALERAPTKPVARHLPSVDQPDQVGSESLFGDPGKDDFLWDQFMHGQLW
jgi:hypothetical protein